MFNVRTFFRVAPLLLVMALATSAANAQSDAPSGKVSIETTSIAAGIGRAWVMGNSTSRQRVSFFYRRRDAHRFGISSLARWRGLQFNRMAKFEGNDVPPK